LITRAA